MMKNGTQIPGPFATRWVVPRRCFIAKYKMWIVARSVVIIEVTLDCFTSFVLFARINVTFDKKSLFASLK